MPDRRFATPTEREAAREVLADLSVSDAIEVDDDATVSEVDEGTYWVQCWVRVEQD